MVFDREGGRGCVGGRPSKLNLRFFEGKWQALVVEERMIVFFDSDCLMCQGALKWLNRLDAEDRLLFAPLNGETSQRYQIDLSDDSMAVAEEGRIWRASEAVRLAFGRAGGIGLVVAGVLAVIPLKIRNWGYKVIARNRKRIVKSDACGIPEEGMREKLRD